MLSIHFFLGLPLVQLHCSSMWRNLSLFIWVTWPKYNTLQDSKTLIISFYIPKFIVMSTFLLWSCLDSPHIFLNTDISKTHSFCLLRFLSHIQTARRTAQLSHAVLRRTVRTAPSCAAHRHTALCSAEFKVFLCMQMKCQTWQTMQP